MLEHLKFERLRNWLYTVATINFGYRIKELLLKKRFHSKITTDSPLFIFSTGRAGSYLLYDLLSLSNDFLTVHSDQRGNRGFFNSKNLQDRSNYSKNSKNQFPVEGNYIWKQAGLSFRKLNENPGTINDLIKKKASIERKVLANYKFHLRSKTPVEKRRILDKSPSFSLSYKLVDAIFPDAKYINIVRDPRAVLNSYIKKIRPPKNDMDKYRFKKYGYWGHPPPNWRQHKDESLVQRMCWQVSKKYEMNQKCEDFLDGKYLRVHYEDFVEDPHKIIEQTSKFGNFSCQEIFEVLPDHFTNYNPPWFDKNGNLDNKSKDKLFIKEEEYAEIKYIDKYVEELGYS